MIQRHCHTATYHCRNRLADLSRCSVLPIKVKIRLSNSSGQTPRRLERDKLAEAAAALPAPPCPTAGLPSTLLPAVDLDVTLMCTHSCPARSACRAAKRHGSWSGTNRSRQWTCCVLPRPIVGSRRPRSSRRWTLMCTPSCPARSAGRAAKRRGAWSGTNRSRQWTCCPVRH